MYFVLADEEDNDEEEQEEEEEVEKENTNPDRPSLKVLVFERYSLDISEFRLYLHDWNLLANRFKYNQRK
jgi:hypothetical protein